MDDNNILFDDGPDLLRCEGCGQYFEETDLKACRVCGKYYCPACRQTHDCRKPPFASARAQSHIVQKPAMTVPEEKVTGSSPSQTAVVSDLPSVPAEPEIQAPPVSSVPVQTVVEKVRCDSCGGLFDEFKMRKCEKCGAVLCSSCWFVHRCHAESDTVVPVRSYAGTEPVRSESFYAGSCVPENEVVHERGDYGTTSGGTAAAAVPLKYSKAITSLTFGILTLILGVAVLMQSSWKMSYVPLITLVILSVISLCTGISGLGRNKGLKGLSVLGMLIGICFLVLGGLFLISLLMVDFGGSTEMVEILTSVGLYTVDDQLYLFATRLGGAQFIWMPQKFY